MTELRPIIVFHGRHFVRNLGICNASCVNLLQIMFGVIPRNLKKNAVSITNRFPEIRKRGIQTDTQTHRHTDTHTHRHTNTHTTHTHTHARTHTHTHTHARTHTHTHTDRTIA